jgi:hypothetical protein
VKILAFSFFPSSKGSPGEGAPEPPLSCFLLSHSAGRAATAAGTTSAAGNAFAPVGAGAAAASCAAGPAGLSGGHIFISSYRDLDRLDRDGTFAPLRRALLNPMAMAC